MSAAEGVLARGWFCPRQHDEQPDDPPTDWPGVFFLDREGGQLCATDIPAVCISLAEYERLKRCEAEVQSVNAEQGVRSDPNYQSEGLAELAERGYQRLKRRKP